MRFIFKTDYEQDIRLAKHGGQAFWYGLLGLFLLAAPWLLSGVLAGAADLRADLRHRRPGADAAGRLHRAVLASATPPSWASAPTRRRCWPTPAGRSRWRWPVPAGLSAVVGIVVGVPALRVKGIYLGIATLAFGFIVEEGMARWEIGDRRQRRHARQVAVAVRLDAGQQRRVLLPVPGGRGAGHAGHPEPAALADRARLRRDPRFGDLGAEHGHPPGALQDHVLRAVGRRWPASAARCTRTRSSSCRPSSSASCSRSTCC